MAAADDRGDAALHVGGAAAVEAVAVGLPGEGVPRPARRAERHGVDVAGEADGRLLGAADGRDEAGARVANSWYAMRKPADSSSSPSLRAHARSIPGGLIVLYARSSRVSAPGSSAFTLRPSRGGAAPAARPVVQRLDHDREEEREVDVALGNVEVHAVGDQDHADEDEEGEREHLHRRVVRDEVRKRRGSRDHHRHRRHHRDDHHPEVVDHADRGDDRIEREDDVDHRDLRDDGGERRPRRSRDRVFLVGLHLRVDLARRLEEQEEAAAQEDQVAPRELERPEGRDRLREPDDPREQREEHEAGEERKREAHLARGGAAFLGQAVREDRDEEQVVDPEHDLEADERDEAHPDLGIRDPREREELHGAAIFSRRRKASEHDGHVHVAALADDLHAELPVVALEEHVQQRFADLHVDQPQAVEEVGQHRMDEAHARLRRPEGEAEAGLQKVEGRALAQPAASRPRDRASALRPARGARSRRRAPEAGAGP
jgi:hypothetical protein